jgi:SAM-dependent methyltransferase
MSKQKKIGIIICDRYSSCAGGKCFSVEEMKKNGAEVVHFATGMVVGYPPCPDIDHFKEFVKQKYGVDIIIARAQTILVAGENWALPKRSLDLIFVRNVCHHLQDRVEYFRKLRNFLKPNGRIAIIERSKPLTFHGMFGHFVPQETIIKEMKEAEFLVNQEFDFLPSQSFIIFT